MQLKYFYCLLLSIATFGTVTQAQTKGNSKTKTEATEKNNIAVKFTLNVQTNTDCNLLLNDETKGKITKGEIKPLTLRLGTNKITAIPNDKSYSSFSTTYNVNKEDDSKQNNITFELSKIQEKAEEEVKENWFTKVLTNIIEKRKLTW